MLQARIKCAFCERWVDVLGHCNQCRLRMPSSIRSQTAQNSISRGEHSIEMRSSSSSLGRGNQLQRQRHCNGRQQEFRASSCPARVRRKTVDGSKSPLAHKFREESSKKLSKKIKCISCGCWATRGHTCYHCKSPTPYHPPSAASAGDSLRRSPSGLMSVTSSSNLVDDSFSLVDELSSKWSLINQFSMKGSRFPLANELGLKESHSPLVAELSLQESHFPLVNELSSKESHFPVVNELSLKDSQGVECFPSLLVPGLKGVDVSASAIPQGCHQYTQEEVFVPFRRQHAHRVSFSGASTISLHDADVSSPSTWASAETIHRRSPERDKKVEVEHIKFDRDAFCNEWEHCLLKSWFDFQLDAKMNEPCFLPEYRPRTFVESLHDVTSQQRLGFGY